jgi:hypothetical protein
MTLQALASIVIQSAIAGGDDLRVLAEKGWPDDRGIEADRFDRRTLEDHNDMLAEAVKRVSKRLDVEEWRLVADFADDYETVIVSFSEPNRTLLDAIKDEARREIKNRGRYRVTASFERNGQIIDCSQPEVCGSERYETREEAEEAAAEFQTELGDTDLDPTTTFSVAEEET